MGLLESFVEENKQALDDMSPEEALAYAVRSYLEWVDEYQDLTLFWYQEAKNLTSVQFENLVIQEESTAQLFQSLLDRAIKDGKSRVADTRIAAHNIVVLCDMWAFRRWLLRKHYTLEEYTKYQTELILSQVSGGDH
jgi:hypothetical protein